MTIDELINCVGMPYEKYDENGQAQGCMLPVFLMYSYLPRHYDFLEDESKMGEYMLGLFAEHAEIIDINDIIPGDVILMRLMFGLYHPGVYIGNDKVIHCAIDSDMEIMRFSWVRVKGVYRVCQQEDSRLG